MTEPSFSERWQAAKAEAEARPRTLGRRLRGWLWVGVGLLLALVALALVVALAWAIVDSAGLLLKLAGAIAVVMVASLLWQKLVRSGS